MTSFPRIKSHSAQSRSISKTSVKQLNKPSLGRINLFAFAVFSTFAVFIFFPFTATFPITSRYPPCGYIVLVSSERHGSTWFISNAEGCVSNGRTFGNLLREVEIWNHGKVKDITLQHAIDLVRYKTSVKIFPGALYRHRDNVTAFFKTVRSMQIPVFVLRRQLENVFASRQAALRTKVWNADTGGVVVEREFKASRNFSMYKKKTEAFFNNVNTLMRDIGVVWDEVQYEEILGQRVILGQKGQCYIRNCNFE